MRISDWSSDVCSSDLWLSLCMLQLDVYWRGVLEVVGRPDLIDDPRFADGALHQHHAALVAELEAVFASRTLAEWRVAPAPQPGPGGGRHAPPDLPPQSEAPGHRLAPHTDNGVEGKSVDVTGVTGRRRITNT